MQTWAGLRAKGIRTPDVAAWQRVPVAWQKYSAANRARASYPYVMNVYNAPAYQQASHCPWWQEWALRFELYCAHLQHALRSNAYVNLLVLNRDDEQIADDRSL